jgi:riboflavin synthase alpha subunit
MFSGIVETVGTIHGVRATPAGRRIRVGGNFAGGRLRLGESVAVDGVCLTVQRRAQGGFDATAVPETLRLTTLGRLRKGARVNLERALRYGDRVGGHLVQGHVDGLGRVRDWSGGRTERRLRLWAPPAVRRDLVRKGSVAVNGVSLTVAGTSRSGFEVALVPHTLAATNLGGLRPGDPVNLEVDIFARYLRKALADRRRRKRR